MKKKMGDPIFFHKHDDFVKVTRMNNREEEDEKEIKCGKRPEK